MTRLNKTTFTLRLRRGLAAALATALGYEGEPVYTTDTKQVYVCDGTNFLHLPTMDSADKYQDDYEFGADSLGPILVDRDTGTLYRLKVESGVLGIEAV